MNNDSPPRLIGVEFPIIRCYDATPTISIESMAGMPACCAGCTPQLRRYVRAPTTPIRGVPIATSHALDRLARPDVTSAVVAWCLDDWSQVLHRRRLGSDWVLYAGPDCRTTLESAMNALPRGPAAPLRVVVLRLDVVFEVKTLPDRFARPDLPWWERRLSR